MWLTKEGKKLQCVSVFSPVALQLYDERSERKLEKGHSTNDAFISAFQSDFGMKSEAQLAVQIKEPQLKELTEGRTSLAVHSEFCNEVKTDGDQALYPFDRGKTNISSKRSLLIQQLMFRDQFILELAISRYSIRQFYIIASTERTKAMGRMIMAAIQEHRRAVLEETISFFQDTSHTSFVLTEMKQGTSKAPAYALFKPLAKKLRADEVNGYHWKDVFDDKEAAGHVVNPSIPTELEQIVRKFEVQIVEGTLQIGKGELTLIGLVQFMARNCSYPMHLIHGTCCLVTANMVFDNG